MSTPQGLAVPQQRGSLEAGLEFAGTFLSGGVPGIVLTNSPAPPTNFSDARGIRGTSRKRHPPSLRPGFSRVARAPLCRSRTDRGRRYTECDRLNRLTADERFPRRVAASIAETPKM